jgi:hypothetical protein
VLTIVTSRRGGKKSAVDALEGRAIPSLQSVHICSYLSITLLVVETTERGRHRRLKLPVHHLGRGNDLVELGEYRGHA